MVEASIIFRSTAIKQSMFENGLELVDSFVISVFIFSRR